MSSETTEEMIVALEALLERERSALLEGDLEFLVGQLDEKTALVDALQAREDAEGGAIAVLQVKVLRNQALLDNALEGIRSVASRMSALRRIRRSLDTYDAKGRRTTIESRAENQMEKRA